MLGYLTVLFFITTVTFTILLFWKGYELDVCSRSSVPFAYRKIVLDALLGDIYEYTKGISNPWLYYGTLLGSVRSGQMIQWDFDLDLGVTKDEYQKTLDALKNMTKTLTKYKIEVSPSFISRSCKIIHIETGLSADVSSFSIRNGEISRDVWWFYSRYVIKEPVSSMPEDYILPLVSVKYENIDVYIPAKAKDVLTILYGKDYMTPDHVCNEYGYCKKR